MGQQKQGTAGDLQLCIKVKPFLVFSPPQKSPKVPQKAYGGGHFTYVRIISTFSPSRNRFSEIRAGRKTAKTCFPKKAILGALRTLQVGLAQTSRITVFFAFRPQKRPRGGPKIGKFKRPRRPRGQLRKRFRQKAFRGRDPSVRSHPLIVI